MKFLISIVLSAIFASALQSGVAAPEDFVISRILTLPLLTKDYALQTRASQLERELIDRFNNSNRREIFKITCEKGTSNGSYFSTHCHPAFLIEAIEKNRRAWRQGEEAFKQPAQLYEVFKEELEELDLVYRALVRQSEELQEIEKEILEIRKVLNDKPLD